MDAQRAQQLYILRFRSQGHRCRSTLTYISDCCILCPTSINRTVSMGPYKTCANVSHVSSPSAAPVGLLKDKICYYWYQGKNDKQILRHLLDCHINTTQYGLGMTNFKALRKSMDLLSTRQQGHTVMSIREAVEEIRVFNTTAGILDMKSLLLKKKGIKVSR